MMSNTSLECKRIISRSFGPGISVASSPDTEQLCRDMGYDSLLDLLYPFGKKVSGRVTVRDSQSVSNPYDDFSVRFIPRIYSQEEIKAPDVSMPQSSALHGASSVQQSPGSGYMNSSLLSNTGSNSGPLTGNYGVSRQLFRLEDLESLLYEKMRHMGGNITDEVVNQMYLDFFSFILSSLPLSPFETFAHPVAGIIAISSRNDTPIDTLSALYKQSHDPQIPDFINQEYLRYYVLIHDEQRDSLDKSVALFEKMKRHFGINCHLVRVNRSTTDSDGSKSSENTSSLAPDTTASTNSPTTSLHPDDENSIRIFVRELVVQSVVPFMERCISTWNDQIASSRRGITGRLFSASKKYFASSTRATSNIISSSPFSQSGFFTPSNSSSPSPSPPIGSVVKGNFNSTFGSYAFNTPEGQLRKLADFAFMLRDYKLAYTTYDLLKRDFHNDKAWSHLAASQEMAAVSFLMYNDYLSSKARIEIIDTLLDSAVYSYISRCTLPTYALRCIVMTIELLGAINQTAASLKPSVSSSVSSNASEGAAKWILKALNEKLLGRLGYVTLMERMSAMFSKINQPNVRPYSPSPSISSSLNSKVDLSRPTSSASSRTEFEKFIPSSGRSRKAAFWTLLAAREWYDAKQYERSMYCISKADDIYGSLPWTRDPKRALGRLLAANSQCIEALKENDLKDDTKIQITDHFVEDIPISKMESLSV